MSAEFLLALFVQYGYWIVFLGILLDNAGLPLPGELLLLTFGAVAGTGDLHVGYGILVAWLAAVSGDNVGYWLGRLGGDRVLHTYCRFTLGSGQCVRNALGYYERHGRATVVFGRFVMGVRAFLTPLAGAARMPLGQFLLVDGLGALIWSSLFIAAGYSVGWRVDQMQHGYRTGYVIIVGALTLSVAAYLLMKLYRRRRHGPGDLSDTPGRGDTERLGAVVAREPLASDSRALEPASIEESSPHPDIAGLFGEGQPPGLALHAPTSADENPR
jgi:membrane protein DedA with SNARE-associated domain